MDKIITKQEEEIFRLVHHDFEGVSVSEAAKRLGISQSTVSRALSRLKKKAPQLFPILTPYQKFIYDCIVEKGLTHQAIADLIGKKKSTVEKTVEAIRRKGFTFAPPPKTEQFNDFIEGKIRQKF